MGHGKMRKQVALERAAWLPQGTHAEMDARMTKAAVGSGNG